MKPVKPETVRRNAQGIRLGKMAILAAEDKEYKAKLAKTRTDKGLHPDPVEGARKVRAKLKTDMEAYHARVAKKNTERAISGSADVAKSKALDDKYEAGGSAFQERHKMSAFKKAYDGVNKLRAAKAKNNRVK